MRLLTAVSFACSAFAAAQAAPPIGNDLPPNAWTENAPQGYKIKPRLDQSPTIDNAKRKEILYGPWELPAGGMIKKYVFGAARPCNNCFVTAMQATIKHQDTGKEALTSEGLWLHHTVLVGNIPGGRGLIWAAGNERPTLRLNSQYKYGLDWPSNMTISSELMSEAPKAVNLSLSILYEYVEKSAPEAKPYKGAYMRWTQIGAPAAVENKIYQFKSAPMKSEYNGKLLYAIGHMHDGGTDIKLFVNDKEVCKSVMRYGGRPGYEASNNAPAMSMPGHNHGGAGMPPSAGPEAPMPGHNHGGAGMPPSAGPEAPMPGHNHGRAAMPPPAAPPGSSGKNHRRRDGPHGGHGGQGPAGTLHISDPGLCENFGDIKKGDVLTTLVSYDTIKYPIMTHNGHAEDLMGNMRVYIGPE